MTPTIKEKLKAIHRELNAMGHYNTYLVIEDIPHKSITLDCYTEKEEVTEKEKKSFCELADYITPYFRRRLEKFTEN